MIGFGRDWRPDDWCSEKLTDVARGFDLEARRDSRDEYAFNRGMAFHARKYARIELAEGN